MLFLGIPSMLFFYAGTDLVDVNYRSYIQSLSLGNLGTATNVAGNGVYETTRASEVNPIDRYATISLSCAVGTLWKIEEFG